MNSLPGQNQEQSILAGKDVVGRHTTPSQAAGGRTCGLAHANEGVYADARRASLRQAPQVLIAQGICVPLAETVASRGAHKC